MFKCPQMLGSESSQLIAKSLFAIYFWQLLSFGTMLMGPLGVSADAFWITHFSNHPSESSNFSLPA